ncbi:MAG TPA: hypothetical protein VFQ77_05785 [Pseudonocardiaceae bacterium]|jgi:hypothetical protein|nr:hypothetical protein [Pseudonocardiaceae bacterium]
MTGVWDSVGEFAGGVVDGAGEVVGGIARGVGDVVGVFDIGEARGTAGGSSNWAAWGHAEICAMLDTTVEPADIDEGARAWAEWNRRAADIITQWTVELRAIVSAGWRGASADAALASLGPVDSWVQSLSDNGEHTAKLLDSSGYSAGQAKATVPPAVSHDWRQSLTSFGLGGPGAALVDAVAQDRAQAEAHADAVRIMTNVYSAPINDNLSALQPPAQLSDPTVQPPEPSPDGGPRLSLYPAEPVGQGGPGGLSGPDGGRGGSGSLPNQPPSVANLQNVAGSSGPGFAENGPFGPAQPTGPQQPVVGHGGSGKGSGAGAVPFIPPMTGGGIGSDAERAHRGFRAAGPGSGRPSGIGGTGGGASFGPRGSGGTTAGPGTGGVGEGRAGSGTGMGGAAATGRGGGGVGGVPVGGAGPGRGGEDTEHQRPSYLIEMNDIFSDGRKVAPPVIGEDPPEHYR